MSHNAKYEEIEFFQDKVAFPYALYILGLNYKSEATFKKQACIS